MVDGAGLHGIEELPGKVKKADLSAEVNHGDVKGRRWGEMGEASSPIEEGERLGEGDAMADGGTVDDVVDDWGGRDHETSAPKEWGREDFFVWLKEKSTLKIRVGRERSKFKSSSLG
ncbi:hypothetical protein ACLOJK_008720 [Asimina triloba]